MNDKYLDCSLLSRSLHIYERRLTRRTTYTGLATQQLYYSPMTATGNEVAAVSELQREGTVIGLPTLTVRYVRVLETG